MVIFNSYVSLPEGMFFSSLMVKIQNCQGICWDMWDIFHQQYDMWVQNGGLNRFT